MTQQARGGTAQTTTRRSAPETRRRLLGAARDAFSELGYISTRVDDIVQRAGTSHGTFYTYFRDKKDALVGLTSELAQTLYGAALAPPLADESASLREIVRRRIAAFLEAYRSHWGIVRSWSQAEGVHPDVEQAKSRIRHAIASAMAELLDRDRERGLVDSGIRSEFVATALVTMTEGFANDWFSAGRSFTDQDVDDLAELWIRAAYRRDR